MSPRKVNPVENGALSLIAERVLNVPSLTHEHGHDGTVITAQAELVVRPSCVDRPGPQGAGAGRRTRREPGDDGGPAHQVGAFVPANGKEARARTTSPTQMARSAGSRSGG